MNDRNRPISVINAYHKVSQWNCVDQNLSVLSLNDNLDENHKYPSYELEPYYKPMKPDAGTIRYRNSPIEGDDSVNRNNQNEDSKGNKEDESEGSGLFKSYNTFLETMHAFSQETTMHGIKYVTDFQVSFCVRRFLWLLALLVVSGTMTYQIYKRMDYFFQYPVTVRIEMNFNESMVFPSLAFCNMNAYRRPVASRKKYIRFLMDFYEATTKTEKLNVINKYGKIINGKTRANLLHELGHTLKEMLVECRWKGIVCNYTDFSEIVADQGLCYTFNYNEYLKNARIFRDLSNTGANNGLQLTLNIQQYDYMVGPNDAEGLKILLYTRTEPILVKTLGQAISAGSHTYGAIKVSEVTALPKPYGECVESGKSQYYPDYTQTGCEEECWIEFVTGSCGCRFTWMANNYPTPNRQNGEIAKECTLFNEIDCANEALAKVTTSGDCKSKCKINCNVMYFEPNLSYATTSGLVTGSVAKYVRKNNIHAKFIEARDIEHFYTKLLRQQDRKLIQNVKNWTEVLDKFVNSILVNKISDTWNNILASENEIQTLYNNYKFLLEWQNALFKQEFYGPYMKHKQNYYDSVVENSQTFITNLRILFDYLKSVTGDPLTLTYTTAMYQITRIQIQTKIYLVDRSLAAFKGDLDSYYTGEIRNKEVIISIDGKKYGYQQCQQIVPRSVIQKSFLRDTALATIVNNTRASLLNIKGKLGKLLELISNYKTADGNEFEKVAKQYKLDLVEFSTQLYTLEKDAFPYPLTILEDRSNKNKELYEAYKNIVQDLKRKVHTLEIDLYNARIHTWPRIKDVYAINIMNYKMNETKGEFEPLYGKTNVAKPTVRKMFQSDLIELNSFLTMLRTQTKAVSNQFLKLHEAAADVWNQTLDDPTTERFYAALNLKKNWKSKIAKMEDLKRTFEQYIKDVKSNDNSKLQTNFLKGWEDMIEHYNLYLEKNRIDTEFYRNNFLNLDLFYKELSYTMITQQVAYDIFGLFCDVGGSLGLFVGASLLTIFELFDVVTAFCCMKCRIGLYKGIAVLPLDDERRREALQS